jgi:hypothetical protein
VRAPGDPQADEQTGKGVGHAHGGVIDADLFGDAMNRYGHRVDADCFSRQVADAQLCRERSRSRVKVGSD